VAGIFSALLVPLIALVLGLIVELLTTRDVVVPVDTQSADVESWAGKTGISDEGIPGYRHRGLLPLVYRNRDKLVLGPLLVSTFKAWPAVFGRNFPCLLTLVVIGLVLAALESLSLAIMYHHLRRVALDAEGHLRREIHRQAFRLGTNESASGSTSRPEELIVRACPEVRAGLIRWWRAMPRSPVLLATLLLLMLMINVWLTVAAVVFAIMIWLLYGWLGTQAEARAHRWEGRALHHTAMLLEQLRQVPLVTGYLLSEIPGEPLDALSRRHREAAEKAATSDAAVGPIVNLFVLAGAGLIIFLVGVNVLREPQGMTVSGTVVLGTALVTAYFPVRRLYLLCGPLHDADQAAADIFAYLDREPSVLQVPDAKTLGPVNDRLQLEAVTLADTKGNKLLDGVSLTVSAGTRVALVASEPAAAMALANMLTRFSDPTAGRILCDGLDIRTVTLKSLRSQVALVGGDGMLFAGTVSENIRCGDSSYTQLQVTDAAKQARAYNFIQQLASGFSATVGERGVRLDPGQALRIGLARVALREPSLLVVQEPDEPIDETSSGHLAEALRHLAHDRTLILVPSQLATLRSADRVLLLHEGKVVADGPHSELIQQSELYRHITYVRFNEFRHTMVKYSN